MDHRLAPGVGRTGVGIGKPQRGAPRLDPADGPQDDIHLFAQMSEIGDQKLVAQAQEVANRLQARLQKTALVDVLFDPDDLRPQRAKVRNVVGKLGEIAAILNVTNYNIQLSIAPNT